MNEEDDQLPHVVIEEALDLGLACQGIKIAAVRNGSEILKVMDVYSSRSGHTALVDSVVVEDQGGGRELQECQGVQLVAPSAPMADGGERSKRRS